jgi:hypothetical protein
VDSLLPRPDRIWILIFALSNLFMADIGVASLHYGSPEFLGIPFYLSKDGCGIPGKA